MIIVIAGAARSYISRTQQSQNDYCPFREWNMAIGIRGAVRRRVIKVRAIARCDQV